jgi:hypothetical protein
VFLFTKTTVRVLVASAVPTQIGCSSISLPSKLFSTSGVLPQVTVIVDSITWALATVPIRQNRNASATIIFMLAPLLIYKKPKEKGQFLGLFLW